MIIKRKYQQPTLEVVKIQHHLALLAGSPEIIEYEIDPEEVIPIKDQDAHFLEFL
ncbi:MAG: hypothetical protein IJ069_08255 [Prevotella sp.]|nr:hypothetical protein [Prevotella sp.]